MNRQIKFRVFDPAQKKFINPTGYFFNADFSEKLFCGELKIANESNSKNCIISQFTGMKDKNGVEIYDGDIVGILQILTDTIEFFGIIYYLCDFRMKGGFPA